jgi:3-oxoacyl-(acyl-carrier-protein) synthase
LSIKMATDLMNNKALDCCLVIGAEEADWILCDAYHKWRFLRAQPPIELFRNPPRGTILSEGAGAVLIAREGEVEVDKIQCGGNFSHREDATGILRRILLDLDKESFCIIGSANGTFVDLAEESALRREHPGAPVYTPKQALGESVGASAMWQVIAGAQCLRTRCLPPLLPIGSGSRFTGFSRREIPGRNAIILSCGLNEQAAGLLLSA